MAKYCPECRKDCDTAACPTDDKGFCVTCGKPPVDARDRHIAWLWCDQHWAWHREVCAENTNRHCCTPAAA